MEHIKKYDACPVCDATQLEVHLDVTDWMITKEVFTIQACTSCGFHFTNPIPSEDTIGTYYKSEDYVSHSSTNKGLVNKLYNFVRNITLDKKVSLVRSYAKGDSILDIGSGTGHFLNVCKKNGFDIQGLEPDMDARSFATLNFDIALDPLDTLDSIKSNSKDVITMWHVLEHVYHLKRDIAQITRVLKEDGTLFIAVPNMNSYDAKLYKEYWAAYDVPRHLYHFQEDTIKQLFSQFEMVCVDVLPMKFDAFYVSMLSEKYKGGSIVKAFLNGWISNMKSYTHGYSSQIYVFQKK